MSLYENLRGSSAEQEEALRLAFAQPEAPGISAADTSRYVAVNFPSGTELPKFGNQRSNIGNFAKGTFQPSRGATVEFDGQIIDVFPAGFSVYSPATGQIQRINRNEGSVTQLFLKPSALNAKRQTFDRASDLDRYLSEQPDSLIAILTPQESQKVVVGRVKKMSLESGQVVYQVTDMANRVHHIDPTRVGIMFDGTVFEDTAETRGWFRSLNAVDAPPVSHIDEMYSARKDWARRLTESGNVYDNPEFYDFQKRDLANVRATVDRWWKVGDKGPKMIERVEREIGADYLPLLLDPAISNRLDSFLSFSKSFLRQKSNITPIELRRAFSSHLGTRKVYRTMVLTAAEAEIVKREGVKALGVINKNEAHFMETFVPNDTIVRGRFGNSPLSEVRNRLTDSGDPKNSMYVSVSGHREVSESIGYYDSGKDLKKGHKIFVFEIEVPELATIARVGLFKPEVGPQRTHLLIGDAFRTDLEGDPEVELFVPYHIQSGWIRSVSETTTPPPRYRRTRVDGSILIRPPSQP